MNLNRPPPLDREVPPATELRQQATTIVNERQNCRAYVTKKRALENYLHPIAVRQVSGLDLTFTDEDDVADLVARACFERHGQRLRGLSTADDLAWRRAASLRTAASGAARRRRRTYRR